MLVSSEEEKNEEEVRALVELSLHARVRSSPRKNEPKRSYRKNYSVSPQYAECLLASRLCSARMGKDSSNRVFAVLAWERIVRTVVSVGEGSDGKDARVETHLEPLSSAREDVLVFCHGVRWCSVTFWFCQVNRRKGGH